MAETDETPEEIMALFGPRAAGKTRLVATIMELVLRNAEGNRIPAGPADAATMRAHRVFAEILRTGGHMTRTGAQAPVAYSLDLGSRHSRRTLRLVDASGELFAAVERIDELEHLTTARSMLFVLDPLSLPEFRDTLRPEARQKVDWSLASPEPPEPIFDQTVQTMLQMGANLRRTRLAVAVTKSDLFEEWATAPVRSTDPAACQRWLSEELGLGNLVRSAQLQFRQARFFFTAAVTSADGVDPSVAALCSWLLGKGRLPRRTRRLLR